MTNVEQIVLSNAEQWTLDSISGKTYLIQASWPLQWHDRTPSIEREVPVIYIMDGNALFLSATEASWRRATGPHYSGGGLVIAIGYRLQDSVFSPMRGYDLTPPADGQVEGFGGADEMLDFIATVLFPSVRERFPKVNIGRKALFGHSYGGLFALHALFTRPQLFDCIIASSPSMGWNNDFIFSEEKTFHEHHQQGEARPVVLLFFGSLECEPIKWHDETSDAFEKRKALIEGHRMASNVQGLFERLSVSPRLRSASLQDYKGEDHGTVMACTLSRSLTTFFEEWGH